MGMGRDINYPHIPPQPHLPPPPPYDSVCASKPSPVAASDAHSQWDAHSGPNDSASPSQPHHQTHHPHACNLNSDLTAFYNHHHLPPSTPQPPTHLRCPALGTWFFQRWLLKPVVMCSIDKQATSAAPRVPPPAFFYFSACPPYTPPFNPHFSVCPPFLPSYTFPIIDHDGTDPVLFLPSLPLSLFLLCSSFTLDHPCRCLLLRAPPSLVWPLVLLPHHPFFSSPSPPFFLASVFVPTFKAACLGNVGHVSSPSLSFLSSFSILTQGNHCCQSVAVCYGRQKLHRRQQQRQHQNYNSP